MMCVEIMRQANQISDDEWNFFLRGAAPVDKVSIKYNYVLHTFFLFIQKLLDKPDVPWLTEQIWNSCQDLQELLPCFEGICDNILKNPVSCKLGRLEIQVNPEHWNGYTELPPEASSDSNDEVTGNYKQWDEVLTDFQKLCMIKCFKEEKVSILNSVCIVVI